MMTTGRRSSLLAAMYGLAVMSAPYGGGVLRSDPSIEPREKKKPVETKPKGCKKFYVNGKEVWALNLKNAIRKASK